MKMLVLIQYENSQALNLHAQLSSGGKDINFGLGLH